MLAEPLLIRISKARRGVKGIGRWKKHEQYGMEIQNNETDGKQQHHKNYKKKQSSHCNAKQWMIARISAMEGNKGKLKY